ncbi:MAG: cytochrome c [Candidatus Eremiobacteraeota bacterium]|nr:cytochrome c [Candidatus Eremiobacteraeota bacterium]
MTKLFAIGALVSLGLLAALPHGARAAGGSLYTAAQATARKTAYLKSCASCHGANLSGVSGPPLKGSAAPYHGSQSVAQVYDYISGQMPLNAPGSLSPKAYVSIMAFLLQQNGHAPGKKPLTAANAQNLEDII